MFARYILADLTRNPRRTLSTTIGVLLGVGLFCSVLFFVDGISASMTQRAVAPLPIDMQRILAAAVSGDVRLELTVQPEGPTRPGDSVDVRMLVQNHGDVPANEVTVRSAPGAGLTFVAGTAIADGRPVPSDTENPFSSGLTKAGFNIGTIPPGGTIALSYQATAAEAVAALPETFPSTLSTREAVYPIVANLDASKNLAELLADIRALDGIAFAEPLHLADLPVGAFSAKIPVDGPVRVFGLDAAYAAHDQTLRIVEGAQRPGAALVSAEAAATLSIGVGDTVTLSLPDGTEMPVPISGIADLRQARALFSSRRGADLEAFVYVPNTLIFDTETFTTKLMPAFARAGSGRGERMKAPPISEIDIGVDRNRLDAEPAIALVQTRQIAKAVENVANGRDFLLDNISNTLAVARDDASVAKAMFVFLGLPGALLAAMIAAYAGVVLGGAQRRERATLRIRGASRRHLLSMLALRVGAIVGAGALFGMFLGYASAAAVTGSATLARVAPATLATSAALGSVMGLLATGFALYLTGRRSIDREINEDRALLWMRPPTWRRRWLDLSALALLALATAVVVARSGFQGTPGSVYVGRAVHLPLGLLILPIGVWIAGCFFGGRLFAVILERWRQPHDGWNARPLALLFRSSTRRRSWPLADASIILALIVALGTSLAVFAASYDRAKTADARYVTGSDLRIVPGPEQGTSDSIADPDAAPIIFGGHNTVLRSKRTSEVANLAALEPRSYARAAPVVDADFPAGSAVAVLGTIDDEGDTILISKDMAHFLQVRVDDEIKVLLARGSTQQIEIGLRVTGLFERLPGFPDGVDAVMNIDRYRRAVASAAPTFFLLKAGDGSETAIQSAVAAWHRDPAFGRGLHLDTRLSMLAKDQSSLAALNIAGLLTIDSAYVFAMGTATIFIFVFGLLLQRRREYVTLRALGMMPRHIRTLILGETATVVIAGCLTGIPIGLAMAWYMINVLRPLFILMPPYGIPVGALSLIVGAVCVAAAFAALVASRLVNGLQAAELLRDE